MKTATILKFLNPVLFFVILLQLAGVVAQQFFYTDWLLEMHRLVGFSIFALIILHVVFNWTWVKNNFFKSKIKKKLQ
jgi:hypothetical protein